MSTNSFVCRHKPSRSRTTPHFTSFSSGRSLIILRFPVAVQDNCQRNPANACSASLPLSPKLSSTGRAFALGPLIRLSVEETEEVVTFNCPSVVVTSSHLLPAAPSKTEGSQQVRSEYLKVIALPIGFPRDGGKQALGSASNFDTVTLTAHLCGSRTVSDSLFHRYRCSVTLAHGDCREECLSEFTFSFQPTSSHRLLASEGGPAACPQMQNWMQWMAEPPHNLLPQQPRSPSSLRGERINIEHM